MDKAAQPIREWVVESSLLNHTTWHVKLKNELKALCFLGLGEH